MKPILRLQSGDYRSAAWAGVLCALVLGCGLAGPARAGVPEPGPDTARPAGGQAAGANGETDPGGEAEVEAVRVVGTSPLPGTGVPLAQVPANVQRVGVTAIESAPTASFGDLLQQNLGSVNLNNTQGTAFQPDVNFRGFTASPILGTPQGLSVFVDGVRVNEAFGDVVNWDLIPRAAISAITVVPGSNPVYGLNTLGGALVVETKTGAQFPGTTLSAYGGSFGRQVYELSTGGVHGGLDYFITGSYFDENGWSDESASRAKQVFGKFGYRDADTRIQFVYSYADTLLHGSQAIPLEWIAVNPRQIYTYPDYTGNTLQSYVLDATRQMSAQSSISANLYYRVVQTRIFNSNVNGDYDPGSAASLANSPAVNVTNAINQYRPGGSLQWNQSQDVLGLKNILTAGLSYEQGSTDFTQSSQAAFIAPDRSTASDAPAVLGTVLHSTSAYGGAYFSDTLMLGPASALTLSGRYNQARLVLEDGLGTALNGTHDYSRFNPGIGLSLTPSPQFNPYVSYNEGMRVPTPVELTCASPQSPCSLPNAFSADPGLKAVVSRTWELGVRSRLDNGVRLSAALFRTDLQDDIQFVSSGGSATTAGYFENVGSTRRQGLELGLEAKAGRATVSAHYSLVDATYRSALVLNSPSNSSAAPITCAGCADIQVTPGDRIPGIPMQQFNLRLRYELLPQLNVGATLVAQSSVFARGDENNLDQHGPVPGFAVLNFDANWELQRGLSLFATVSNVFDRAYATYGVLGQNVFTGPGNSFDPSGASWHADQFRAPGAPLGAWLGIRYRIGPAG